MLKLIAKAQSRFIKDENGATAIEYGLIAAGISLAIASIVFLFGDDLVALFDGMRGTLNSRTPAAV